MSDFRQRVYELTRQIPEGKVATYGQLAKLAGRVKAARAVGVFMRTNPDAPHTPCHRVVSFNGKLTGYSGRGGILQKREMLISEGVKFLGDRVNLQESLWVTQQQ
ncbi:MAG: MGMT family protein [Candidatus Woesebacteria bacterium]|nr:MAG: MGMT family protein [Candidatus Woesebacteria bacterium]